MSDTMQEFWDLLILAHRKKLAGLYKLTEQEIVSGTIEAFRKARLLRDNVRLDQYKKRRERYNALKAQGLCVHCGGPAPNGAYCDYHLSYYREYGREYRRKREGANR